MVDDDGYPILGGGDCVLRVLRPSDAEAWHAGEDEEQRRWFEFPHPAPFQNVVDWIAESRAQWADGAAKRHWGIWHNGALAGGADVDLRDDGRASVSYLVFPDFRRRGLASEAVRLVSRWAFDNLGATAIVGVVDERNVASRAVLASAGFDYDDVAEPWEYSESGVMLRYVLSSSPAA